jgi:hypothetical protein
MNRYQLKPTKPEHEGYEITIGWEKLLGNFFSEVRLPREGEWELGGEVVVSIREQLSKAPSVADFNRVVEAISSYADVDHDLRMRLWADSREEGSLAL